MKTKAFALLLIALLAASCGAEEVKTVEDLRHAVEAYPAQAPVFIEQGAVVKPLAVEARDGAAVLVEAKPVVPEPWPPVHRRKPHGLFALQAGGQSETDRSFPHGGRLISMAQLLDPDLAGLTIRFQRQHVLNSNGTWNESGWQQINQCVVKARTANKPYTFLPMGGGPVTASSLADYDRIDLELAERYGRDSYWCLYHVGGSVSSPGASEEWHWTGGMSQTVINQAIARIKHAHAAVPDMLLTIAIGGGARNEAAIRKIADAVKDQGEIIWKHNALMAFKNGMNTFATYPNIPQNKFLISLCKDNPQRRMGFEMARASRDNLNGKPAQGTRDINDSIRQGANLIRMAGENPAQTYIAIYQPDIGNIKAETLRN